MDNIFFTVHDIETGHDDRHICIESVGVLVDVDIRAPGDCALTDIEEVEVTLFGEVECFTWDVFCLRAPILAMVLFPLVEKRITHDRHLQDEIVQEAIDIMVDRAEAMAEDR